MRKVRAIGLLGALILIGGLTMAAEEPQDKQDMKDTVPFPPAVPMGKDSAPMIRPGTILSQTPR